MNQATVDTVMLSNETVIKHLVHCVVLGKKEGKEGKGRFCESCKEQGIFQEIPSKVQKETRYVYAVYMCVPAFELCKLTIGKVLFGRKAKNELQKLLFDGSSL